MLEAADGLTECLPFPAVVQGPGQSLVGAGHRGHRHREPLLGEVAHELGEARSLLAQTVGHRHPHVGEEELGGVLGVQTDLVEVATPFEALHAALEDQQAHALVALGGVGLDRDDHQVCVDPVGDEGLGAVHDVVVSVAHRARAHGGQVRTHGGFGHGDSGDQLARDDPGQPAGRLLSGGPGQQVGEADVVVESEAQPRTGHPGPLDLLAQDHVEPEVGHSRAAEGLGNGHGQESGPAGGQEQLAGNDPRLLPVGVVRDDLALDEGAHAGAEEVVLVGEKAAAHGGHPTLGPCHA